MACVFKKITTRQVPKSAIITQKGGKKVARWKSGVRRLESEVFVRTDGREYVRQESSTYFAKFRDHDGTLRVESTGCTSRDAANVVLARRTTQVENVRSGITDAGKLAVAKQMDFSINKHIDDYISTLTGSASHRDNTRRYLSRLAESLAWAKLSDLRRDSLEVWLAEQAQPGADGRPVRSARSRNAFHTAAVAFANWCVRAKRLSENPFSGLKKADVARDRRKTRRALSPEEIERLAKAAEQAPERPSLHRGDETCPGGRRPAQRLSGSERGLLWRFLAGTGLRLNEARSLRVGDLELRGKRPRIYLRAAITKSGTKDEDIPLYPGLAERLQAQVRGRNSEAPVFDIPADILKRFKADCRRAGIPMKDERGREIDIHALRTSFITNLAKRGVHPRTAQALARHSDINLTMRVYTDVRADDLNAAVAVLDPAAGTQEAGHEGVNGAKGRE